MVKASNNKNHVDLENAVIGGSLKQIKCPTSKVSDPKNPELISVWTCDIRPIQTKSIIKLMAEEITPYDEVSLVHVKRLKKLDPEEKTRGVVIRAILCSTEFLTSKAEVCAFMKEKDTMFDEEFSNIQRHELPRFLPPTKETALLWSTQYWPMSWKGNPNHQTLLTTEFDLDIERNMVLKLEQLASEEAKLGKVPIVTIIAKPERSSDELNKPIWQILAIGYDTRHQYPLGHSVMNVIKLIANNELERRQNSTQEEQDDSDNYLCHNLLVYTTHEPCVMCSMALVHSRIGRLVYVKDSPKTGALGSCYNIGDRDGLNWKFDTWKWINSGEVQKLENIPNINLAKSYNV